jgi:hypothetical protein
MLSGHLALIAAALFTGAAFYIHVAEQPARLLLDDQALLTEWKLAYKRGTLMQATLAIVGFLLGLFAWWQTGVLSWLVGGMLMFVNWPFTLIVIMPTNNRLMATEAAGPETRSMIVKWAGLHAVRTALGIAAMILFLTSL